MLDTLTEAWAANNGGANIWADKTVKFLDPCTKSGVFLREITSRLNKGLEKKIPDLQKRVDHILTEQVFGIGITQITSLLARRSVYCSKDATSEHSIAKLFTSDEGNIWFQRTEHTWGETKCEFCGAPRAILDREAELENYAYAFIHTDNIKARLSEIFGGNMQFDVIIGNPPYQMKGGAGGSSDSSIYHLFVQQALNLESRFVSMVVPSRWMAVRACGVQLRKLLPDSLFPISRVVAKDHPTCPPIHILMGSGAGLEPHVDRRIALRKVWHQQGGDHLH
jgi:site-specific DNA-methyltransferase (adenine-specific)